MMDVRKKHKPYVEKAIELANKSLMIKKHGCVVVKNNNIIGCGYNKHVPTLKDKHSLHAEVAAISDAKRSNQSLENATLYVVRVKNGVLCQSLPCDHCRNFIIKNKISNVFFSLPLACL